MRMRWVMRCSACSSTRREWPGSVRRSSEWTEAARRPPQRRRHAVVAPLGAAPAGQRQFLVRDGRIDLGALHLGQVGTEELPREPSGPFKLVVNVSAPEGSKLSYEAESYRITKATSPSFAPWSRPSWARSPTWSRRSPASGPPASTSPRGGWPAHEVRASDAGLGADR